MPERLYFTDSDEANALIASDPMALLIGFVLDQQVPVQKAFSGPLDLRERLGTLDAAALASADLEPVFRERPAIHRFPGSMARRVHDLAVHVRDRYDGDAARVWTDAANADELRANIELEELGWFNFEQAYTQPLEDSGEAAELIRRADEALREARYWDVAGMEDAAWSYEYPRPESTGIAGHLAFDPQRVTITIG